MANGSVVDIILKMDAYMLKKGRDLSVKRELIKAITTLCNDAKLCDIYVNELDRVNLPDVVVAPVYQKNINDFLLNPDITYSFLNGYTIEINSCCFTKYTAEELTAIVLHHLLQNIQSCSAKSRFMEAFTKASYEIKEFDPYTLRDDKYPNNILGYIMYLDICLRPINVPVNQYSPVSTDMILINMKLDDAFNSALRKMINDDSMLVVSDAMLDAAKLHDKRTIRTMMMACVNNDLSVYYNSVYTSLPICILCDVFKINQDNYVIGANKPCSMCKPLVMGEKAQAVLESFLNPKDEIELRYQIDKIITDMRFMEHADERNELLFRTRNLTVKMAKTRIDVMKKLEKTPGDQNLVHKLEYLDAMIAELEQIRQKIVKTELQPHQIGLVVKYPAGYNY